MFYFFQAHGKDVKTVAESPLEDPTIQNGKDTVTYEARLLKELLLQLQIS